MGRHVPKNALAPVFALVASGLLVAFFVGIYVVELAFGLPEIAEAFFLGFQDRDFAVIIGTVVFPVFAALLGNLALDVVSALVDPRVARGGK